MREIKFRVWNDYTNEMKLDYSGFTNEFDVLNLTEFFNIENHLYLMQYTGVKDINNKEIYEGDIVRVSYSITTNEISKVEFKRGIFYVLKNSRYHALSEFMYDYKDRTKDFAGGWKYLPEYRIIKRRVVIRRKYESKNSIN